MRKCPHQAWQRKHVYVFHSKPARKDVDGTRPGDSGPLKINSKREKQSRKSEKERKEKRKKGDSRERHPSNRNTSWVGLEPAVPIHLADESHSYYPITPPDLP